MCTYAYMDFSHILLCMHMRMHACTHTEEERKSRKADKCTAGEICFSVGDGKMWEENHVLQALLEA